MPMLRVIDTLSPPSPQLARAFAGFGMALRGRPEPDARRTDRAAVRAVLDALALPGGVALIEGPSGSGKSTLLRSVCHACAAQGWLVLTPADVPARWASRSLIDALRPMDGPDAIALLALCGLADAALLPQTPAQLSDGQRARLGLALLVARARELCAIDRHHPHGQPIVVALDEWTHALDEATARSVCVAIERIARAHQPDAQAGVPAGTLRIVLATTREQLAPLVHARVRVACRLGARARIHTPQATMPHPHNHDDAHTPSQPASTPSVDIRPIDGALAHRCIAQLAPHHYRTSAPANTALVLGAFCARTGDAVGVLEVAYPTLNGSWRALAWPELFGPAALAGLDRAGAAHRLNGMVRTISRVVVDPRYRGMGVAKRLVVAYLRQPLTPLTEALAGMGHFSPFFQAAGMRAVPFERAARYRRLLARLEHAGRTPANDSEHMWRGEPWQLIDVEQARRALRDPRVREALGAFVRGGRAGAGLLRDARTPTPRLRPQQLVLAVSMSLVRPLALVAP